MCLASVALLNLSQTPHSCGVETLSTRWNKGEEDEPAGGRRGARRLALSPWPSPLLSLPSLFLYILVGVGFPMWTASPRQGGFTSSDSVLGPELQIEPGHRSILLNE